LSNAPQETINPILTLMIWMEAAQHGQKQLRMYEALCLEEEAETLEEIELTPPMPADGSTPERLTYTSHRSLAAAMSAVAKEMRSGEFKLGVNPGKLLDAHLDSIWVHLGAALALLTPPSQNPAYANMNAGEKLAAAWALLHKSNIDDKRQPDGSFARDASGKITKPSTWTAPDFDQFFF
jgi:hypothetical protein